LPSNPCKEALDNPLALVSTPPATVLRLALFVGTMRRNRLGARGAHSRIERIAVVRLVPDHVLRRRFDHVEIKGEQHQDELMMVRRVCGDRREP
jgi:hypothetical protein